MTFLETVTTTSTPLIGTWLKIPSVVTLEVLATSGLDFLIVDLEHSYIGIDWLHTACAVAQANGVAVLVRVADPSGRDMGKILDLAVDGVIVPQVFTAEDARRAISFTRFENGRRGVGVTSRAGDWGRTPQATYIENADARTTRCIQLETPDSFADLEKILDVEGLNSALFGPADLAAALGVPAGHRELDALSERLLAAAAQRGIPCGTAVGTPEAAARAAAQGYRFIAVSNDASCFAAAARSLVAGTRQLLE